MVSSIFSEDVSQLVEGLEEVPQALSMLWSLNCLVGVRAWPSLRDLSDFFEGNLRSSPALTSVVAMNREYKSLPNKLMKLIFVPEDQIFLNVEKVLSWSYGNRSTSIDFLKLSLEALNVTRIMVLLDMGDEDPFYFYAERRLDERSFWLQRAYLKMLKIQIKKPTTTKGYADEDEEVADAVFTDISQLELLQVAKEVQVFALVQDYPVNTPTAAGCMVNKIVNSARLLKARMTKKAAREIAEDYVVNCCSVEDWRKRWIPIRERVVKDYVHRGYCPQVKDANFYRHDNGKGEPELCVKYKSSHVQGPET